jgi:hypothetical protein
VPPPPQGFQPYFESSPLPEKKEWPRPKESLCSNLRQTDTLKIKTFAEYPSVKINSMELRKCVAVLLLLTSSNTPLTSLVAQCPTRKIEYEISRRMLVQQERAQKGGHQPWRSNAKSVARSGVSQADGILRPAEIDGLRGHIVLESKMKTIFLFESSARKKSYRVTVQRFRIQMPDSRELTTTVWWTTKVIVTDCHVQAEPLKPTSQR